MRPEIVLIAKYCLLTTWICDVGAESVRTEKRDGAICLHHKVTEQGPWRTQHNQGDIVTKWALYAEKNYKLGILSGVWQP